MLNGMAPGNLCLNVAASTLTRQLVSLLGGVPEWAGVMAAVRVEESDEEAEEGAGSAISYLQ
jgi:predicted RNA polymerase sigma factor